MALIPVQKNPTFNCILMDKIYLGDIDCLDNLQDYDVDAVVNVTKIVKEVNNEIALMQIPIDDHRKEPIEQYFDEFYDFCQNHKKILILCENSVSRSPSFTIYYIMRYLKLDFESALGFVSSKRTQYTKPNIGFKRILQSLTFADSAC